MKRKTRLALKKMGVKVIDLGKMPRIVIHVLAIALFLWLLSAYFPNNYRKAVQFAGSQVLMSSLAEDSLLTGVLSRARMDEQFYKPGMPSNYYDFINLSLFHKLEMAYPVEWRLTLQKDHLILMSEYWHLMIRVNYPNNNSDLKNNNFLIWSVVRDDAGRLYFAAALQDIHCCGFWLDLIFVSLLYFMCSYALMNLLVRPFLSIIHKQFYNYYYPQRNTHRIRVGIDNSVHLTIEGLIKEEGGAPGVCLTSMRRDSLVYFYSPTQPQ